LLPGDSTLDRIDGALEFDEKAVAHEFDHAAPILGNQRFDELDPQCLEGGECALLICADEPGIANHVGRKYGGKPAFQAVSSSSKTLAIMLVGIHIYEREAVGRSRLFFPVAGCLHDGEYGVAKPTF
jgi:hypothetical protein